MGTFQDNDKLSAIAISFIDGIYSFLYPKPADNPARPV
jgi:hypothetical protein